MALREDRLEAFGGFALAGAAIWLLAPIAMPDTATEVARHYDQHRTGLIVASVVVVGGSALVAAWYVALAFVTSGTATGRLLGGIGVVGMAIQIAALSVGFAIFAFALALRGQGFGGRWLVPLSVPAALAHLVVAASFADDGFFSPVGGVEIVVPLI